MIEEARVPVNLEEYFSKMNPEDSAAITTMCLEKLCQKAQELKDLYTQLAKSYGIEMGLCDIALLVQVSVPLLPVIPVRGLLGTSEGIKHALEVMMSEGLKDLDKMEKEETLDKDEDE